MFMTTYRKLRTRKTLNDFSVQIRTFLLPLSLKVLRHKERDTIFLCWLFHLAPSSRGARSTQIRHASASPKSRPSRPLSSFNSQTFFEIPQNLRALPVRDVIPILSPCFSSRAIVTSQSDTSALRVHALTLASSLHLTNPCVEPKGSQPN